VSTLRAFEFADPILDGVNLVFARSAGKARHCVVSSARDAGYGLTYADVRVCRAPGYDCIAGKHRLSMERCLLEQAVADQIKGEFRV
jgi:hypothetical protein